MDRPADLLPRDTSTAAETKAVGEALARLLRPGDVLALYGDLGTGKTVLTKGVGSALGVDSEEISSPTFTILNEYAAGITPLYHFDAYRIESPEELFDLGYEEYFFGDGICVVEWADRVESLLPEQAIRLELLHAGQNKRQIRMKEDL